MLLLSIFILCCKTKSDGNSANTAEAKTNSTELAQYIFSDTSRFLRVYVDKYERITLNGNPISIENLDLRLQSLKNKDGIVFYSSYDITSEIPTEGQVIDLIKKYRLANKTFTDSTFTKSFF